MLVICGMAALMLLVVSPVSAGTNAQPAFTGNGVQSISIALTGSAPQQVFAIGSNDISGYSLQTQNNVNIDLKLSDAMEGAKPENRRGFMTQYSTSTGTWQGTEVYGSAFQLKFNGGSFVSVPTVSTPANLASGLVPGDQTLPLTGRQVVSFADKVLPAGWNYKITANIDAVPV